MAKQVGCVIIVATKQGSHAGKALAHLTNHKDRSTPIAGCKGEISSATMTLYSNLLHIRLGARNKSKSERLALSGMVKEEHRKNVAHLKSKPGKLQQRLKAKAKVQINAKNSNNSNSNSRGS